MFGRVQAENYRSPSGCTILALMLLLLAVPLKTAHAGHTLTAQEQETLKTWLASHRNYRSATDDDCVCAGFIKDLRAGYGGTMKPIPDYHPYVATGDFNSDGKRDFAVVVIDRSKTDRSFALLVFNGPLDPNKASPAFMKSDLNLGGKGLFYGPPRPKPYRLLLGTFETDTAWILVPRGDSYVLSAE